MADTHDTAALVARAQANLDEAKAYFAENGIEVTSNGIVPELLAALNAQATEIARLTGELDGMIAAKTNWNVRANDMEARAETSEAALAAALERVAVLEGALKTMRDMMCEGFEDDDGNSGCGHCKEDCTGCIAHAALKCGEA